MTPEGLEELRRHEGLRLEAYPDPGSGGYPWTIGYGHTRGVKKGDTISREQAEHFLLQDVAEAEEAIERLVQVPLSAGQMDALVSFVFNLGAGAFERSTLLTKLRRGDYSGAAAEFDKWVYAAGKVMPGLVARRAAERARFEASIPARPTHPVPANPAPVEDRSVRANPADIDALEKENQPMAPFVAAALPAIMQAVPDLIRMFGGGSANTERNAKAAEMVVEIAKTATGATNAQEAAEKVQNDPDAAAAVREAIRNQWFELVEAGGGGIEGARKMSTDPTAPPFWRQPAFWITGALLPLVYGTVWAVLARDGFSDDVRAMVVSAIVTGVLGAILGYWLGSSAGSARKTDMLKR